MSRCLMILLFTASAWGQPVPTPALVSRLGHPRFVVREDAGRQLGRLERGERLSLRRYLSHPDPEVRSRIRVLYAAAVNESLASCTPFPMIDALWYDTDRKTYAYVGDGSWHDWFRAHTQHHLDALGRDDYPWRNYCLATENLVRGWIEAGVPEWVIKPVLDTMHRRDRVFIDNWTTPALPWPPLQKAKRMD